MNNKNYIKFCYKLDKSYCNFNELGLIHVHNDVYLSAIEFTNETATLYFKDECVSQNDFSPDKFEQHAELKLFTFFLDMAKSFYVQCFRFDIDESCFNDKKIINIKGSIYSGTSFCNAELELKGIEGITITKQKDPQLYNKNVMYKIMLDSLSFINVNEKDEKRFIKLFMMEDPVIKYVILYTWLYEQLSTNDYGSQKEVDNFIINSHTYSKIPENYKEFPVRNLNKSDGTYFTYLRNLIGHSVTHALDVNDINIIKSVKIYTNWLIQILLEKLF